MLYVSPSRFKASKHQCLSVFNWFISEQTHLKLIDDFSTLRAGSVLRPPHPLIGQFIFFYKGILSVQPEGSY